MIAVLLMLHQVVMDDVGDGFSRHIHLREMEADLVDLLQQNFPQLRRCALNCVGAGYDVAFLPEADTFYRLCFTAPYPALDRTALKALRHPVLLTHGDRTQAIHRATTTAVSRYLTHAHIAQVPDSGHGIHRDNAVAFNALVLEFLREHVKSLP